MKTFLFLKPDPSRGYSLLLLALRVFFGLMLMAHGLDKLSNYTELYFTFPDPIGIGKELTLALVIFGELCCSLAFTLGFLYRLCMIPMIIVMSVAFFYIHGGSIPQGELSFIYLITFILLYITGPGKYSVDAIIYKRIHKDEDEDNYDY